MCGRLGVSLDWVPDRPFLQPHYPPSDQKRGHVTPCRCRLTYMDHLPQHPVPPREKASPHSPEKAVSSSSLQKDSYQTHGTPTQPPNAGRTDQIRVNGNADSKSRHERGACRALWKRDTWAEHYVQSMQEEICKMFVRTDLAECGTIGWEQRETPEMI